MVEQTKTNDDGTTRIKKKNYDERLKAQRIKTQDDGGDDDDDYNEEDQEKIEETA